MARTPLVARLVEAASVADESQRRELSVERIIRERIARRELLRRAGVAGVAAAAALTVGFPRLARGAAPRIAVIGAGLAGLTCAYRLKQAGYAATIYEASDRAGGRCWTIRGAFAENQIAEHGGEMIDQGHTAMRQLTNELGFTLDNLLRAEVRGTEPMYFFDNQPYTFADATDDLKGIWQ